MTATTSVDALVARVLLPLARGGTISVGAPIASGVARRWALEAEVLSPPDAGSVRHELALARARTAALLVVDPPHLALSGDDVRVGVALHDALVAAHPRAAEVAFARRVRGRVVAHALALAQAPPARGRTALLARHTLLARLGELGRTDRLVKWWTGDALFRGHDAPARLRAMPRLRRVREERKRIALVDLLRADDGVPQAAIGALYASSPLTDLLDAARPLPAFSWTPATAAIAGDAELARAILYRWLGAAPTATDLAGAPASAAAALVPLLERRPAGTGPLVAAIVPWLIHVTILVAAAHVAAVPGREATRAPTAIEDALERLGRRPHEGLATLLALPEAARRAVPHLAAPRGIEGALAARLDVIRRLVTAALGEEPVQKLADRLAHAARC